MKVFKCEKFSSMIQSAFTEYGSFPRRGLRAAMVLAVVTLVFSTGLVYSAPLNYWTFEGTDGDIGSTGTWWQDKLGNEDLGGGTSGTVGQLTLPATGAGSAFPNPVPQTEASNENGMDVSAGWTRPAGTNAFNASESITVEGMFNITDTSGGQELIKIRDGSGSKFLARVANGELDGSAYDSDGDYVTSVKSGLTVSADTDYYFGISASAGTDAADRFMTFWLQDLTNDGSLQSETVSLADETDFTSLYQSSDMQLRIGESNNLTVMDEVRYSDSILDRGELLAVPEPGTLALFGLAALLLMRRRRL